VPPSDIIFAQRSNPLNFIDLSPLLDHWPELADGFGLTLLLSIEAWIGSVLIAAMTTGLSLAGPRRLAPVLRAYVEFMRGMPSLVLILACFYLLPATGLRLDPAQSGLMALTLYYGAYFGEIMRGALAVVPAGQWDSGQSIGLAPVMIVWRIILPQALGPMIPPLTGLTIGLIKETALLSTISVHELLFAGKEAISDSYAPFEVYGFIALCYWAVNGTIEGLARRFETQALAYHAPNLSQIRP
jgi:polar amino acid transport system permease protein